MPSSFTRCNSLLSWLYFKSWSFFHRKKLFRKKKNKKCNFGNFCRKNTEVVKFERDSTDDELALSNFWDSFSVVNKNILSLNIRLKSWNLIQSNGSVRWSGPRWNMVLLSKQLWRSTLSRVSLIRKHIKIKGASNHYYPDNSELSGHNTNL